MTASSATPSFLLAAIEESKIGVRVVFRSENQVGISRCPFRSAHEGTPNTGAIIVTDPESEREETLVCRVCGHKAAHQVLRTLPREAVYRAFMRWKVELSHPGVSSSGEEEPPASA